MVTGHISHWYAELLYVLPVVMVVLWLSYQSWREKRSGARAEDPGSAAPDHVG